MNAFADQSVWRTRARRWGLKALRLVLTGLLFGWLYSLAAPKLFPADARAGFGYGILHGAFMPMAMPSLVIGFEVPIYAQHNTGRFYKLGYTVGINICGFIFFGLAFANPRKQAQKSPPT